MQMRAELNSNWGSGELPRKIRTLYGRCRPYIELGPGHFLMYVFGRFSPVRSIMVWVYSKRASKAPSAGGLTFIEGVDVDCTVTKIRQDGYCSGLSLRKEAVEELLQSVSQATCFGDGSVGAPFRYCVGGSSQQQITQTFRRGSYNNALDRFPALRALTRDAQLLAIARQYLGTEPALMGARVW